jgi:hypothetical protein
MRFPLPLFASVLALGGCATVPAGQFDDAMESISFATGPCFGACPMFSVEVGADGEGVYRGERFVAVKGERTFTVSPVQWQAFAARLAPYRPEESVKYGYEGCDGQVVTDQPSVVVTWHGADGEETTLDWYMGCSQPGLAENRERIYGAWQELPLDDLVGTAQDRFRYEKSGGG